jgi:multiple sugar transport system substrate-binding protein
MKTRSAILFIIILFSIILSACQATAPGGKITFMVSGNPAELAAYQKLVDAFKTRNPSIEVEVVHIPDEGDYRKRLTADIAAGSPADVILMNYRRQAAFSNSGAFEPLDDYIANSKEIKAADFYPEAFNAFQWNGKQMCIPQNVSSLVVYYNKDLFTAASQPFPAADWTWEAFLATAQALTKDTNGDGKTDQFGAGIDAELIRFAPFVWQAGGELVDGDFTPSTLMINSPEGLEAGNFFFGLQTEHQVVPSQEEEAARDSQSRFLDGTLAMYFNSRRPVPTFRESAKFDWDVAPLPRNKVAATVLHSDGYCIPSGSKNKDAAWALVEFANSVEGQTIIAGTGRTVPSRIAVANSPAFLDPNAKPASSQVFLDVIPTIHTLPLFQNWAEVEEIADSEIARGFYGQTDTADALNTAIKRTLEIFNEQ